MSDFTKFFSSRAKSPEFELICISPDWKYEPDFTVGTEEILCLKWKNVFFY